MPPKKRAAANPIGAPASKKIKAGVAIKVDPDFQGSSASVARAKPNPIPSDAIQPTLRDQFIDLFSQEQYKGGISNAALKEKFGELYYKLVPIINELTKESRLVMSRTAKNELFYTLVSQDVANKFAGLDTSARMVYQVIERAGNLGIWTRDIRMATNIQQQALNKIFKALETRRLIKPVKVSRTKSGLVLFHPCFSPYLTSRLRFPSLSRPNPRNSTCSSI
jgi:RNA polymerase Rpc34 subunit